MFRRFTAKMKLTKEEQRWVDEQIYFQHYVWNWLVENYNKQIKEHLFVKKKWPTSKILYNSIKNHFETDRFDWCGDRIIKGVFLLYLQAWERTILVKGTQDPNFKKWNKNLCSVYVPNISIKYNQGFRLHTSNKIHYKRKRIIPAYTTQIQKFIQHCGNNLKEYTIVRRNGRYYVSLCFETDVSFIKPSLNAQIGLDWGITNFLTDNFGNTYNFPDKIQKIQNRINSLQRILSCKQQGSKNWEKVRKKLNDAYFHQNNVKKQWIEEITTFFLTNYNYIFIEKLDMNQIKEINKFNKKMLHRMLLFPFGMFRDRLIQKSLDYECQILEIDQTIFPTSQICSCCGHTEFRPLKQRTVNCSKCQNNIDRDVNAALNLVQIGLSLINNETPAC